MAENVGEIYVDVLADLDEAQIKEIALKAKKSLEKRLDHIKVDVDKKKLEAQLKTTQKAIDKALKDRKIEVDLDEKRLDSELKTAQRAIDKALKDRKIEADVDQADLRRELLQAQKTIDKALTNRSLDIDIDFADLNNELARAQALIRSTLLDQNVDVNLDVNQREFLRDINDALSAASGRSANILLGTEVDTSALAAVRSRLQQTIAEATQQGLRDGLREGLLEALSGGGGGGGFNFAGAVAAFAAFNQLNAITATLAKQQEILARSSIRSGKALKVVERVCRETTRQTENLSFGFRSLAGEVKKASRELVNLARFNQHDLDPLRFALEGAVRTGFVIPRLVGRRLVADVAATAVQAREKFASTFDKIQLKRIQVQVDADVKRFGAQLNSALRGVGTGNDDIASFGRKATSALNAAGGAARVSALGFSVAAKSSALLKGGLAALAVVAAALVPILVDVTAGIAGFVGLQFQDKITLSERAFTAMGLSAGKSRKLLASLRATAVETGIAFETLSRTTVTAIDDLGVSVAESKSLIDTIAGGLSNSGLGASELSKALEKTVVDLAALRNAGGSFDLSSVENFAQTFVGLDKADVIKQLQKDLGGISKDAVMRKLADESISAAQGVNALVGAIEKIPGDGLKNTPTILETLRKAAAKLRDALLGVFGESQADAVTRINALVDKLSATIKDNAPQLKAAFAGVLDTLSVLGSVGVKFLGAITSKKFVDFANDIRSTFGGIGALLIPLVPLLQVIGAQLAIIFKGLGLIGQGLQKITPLLKITGALFAVFTAGPFLLVAAAVQKLPALFNAARSAISSAAGAVRDFITGVPGFNALASAAAKLTPVFSAIGGAARSAGAAIKDAFNDATGFIISAINTIIDGYNKLPFVSDIQKIGQGKGPDLRDDFGFGTDPATIAKLGKVKVKVNDVVQTPSGGGGKSAAAQAIDDAKDQIQTSLKGLLKILKGDDPKAINAALSEIEANLRKLNFDKLANRVDRVSGRLRKMARELASVKSRLDAARQAFSATFDTFSGIGDVISDVISSVNDAVGEIDLSKLRIVGTSGPAGDSLAARMGIIIGNPQQVTAQGQAVVNAVNAGTRSLKSALSARLDLLKNLAANANELARKGLSKQLLDELLAGGTQNAGLIAELANASDADIKDLNAIQKGIQDAAKSIARVSRDSAASLGDDILVGAYDRILARSKELEDLMGRVGTALIKAIRRAIRSNSPSLAMRDVADDLLDGSLGQIANRMSEVVKAGDAIGKAMLPTTAKYTDNMRKTRMDNIRAADDVIKAQIDGSKGPTGTVAAIEGQTKALLAGLGNVKNGRQVIEPTPPPVIQQTFVQPRGYGSLSGAFGR